MKPYIAISMGDPAGISPEIIVDSLEDALLLSRPIVFGHYPTLSSVMPVSMRNKLVLLDEADILKDGQVGIVAIGDDSSPIDVPGELAARAQFDALAAATSAVLNGRCQALVTAPVAKNAISSLGIPFSGHTEYLAERAGLKKDDVTMVFVSESLSVGMVTTHIALREVPDAVTWKRLERTLSHVIDTRRRLLPTRIPGIAVAALNPHAGEDGLFGNEEQTLLSPFCKKIDSERDDARIDGPYPADMVFRDALGGKFDGVVAGYHDQALIPLKLGGVGQMVNVTMGLPFIRCSPDHGVAYDIARRGLADSSGLRQALEMAVRLTATDSKE